MLEVLKAWLSRFDLASLMIGAVVGAFISIWLQHFLARPRLRQVGGGSGQYLHITIRNEPGFLGINFGPTIILGRRFSQGWRLGIPFDTSPARACSAVIIDKETGQTITSLSWLKDGIYGYEVTLGPGESANLIVFTRHGADEGKYYVWRPLPEHQSPGPGDIQMDGSREFLIDVRFSHGTRTKRFTCKMVRKLNGAYHFQHETGGGGPV